MIGYFSELVNFEKDVLLTVLELGGYYLWKS